MSDHFHRYCNRITYLWDLSNFDALDEALRPEYAAEMSAKANKKRPGDTSPKSTRGTIFTRELWLWKVRLPALTGTALLFVLLLWSAAAIAIFMYR